MILKARRAGKFVTFCAIFIAPAALGCLWVLLSGLGGPFAPRGGYFWMFSVAAAPWILLCAGLYLLAVAAIRYGLHRAAREHRRITIRSPAIPQGIDACPSNPRLRIGITNRSSPPARRC